MFHTNAPSFPSFNIQSITPSVMSLCCLRTLQNSTWINMQRSLQVASRSMRRNITKYMTYFSSQKRRIFLLILSVCGNICVTQTMTGTPVWMNSLNFHLTSFSPENDVLFISFSKIKRHPTFSSAPGWLFLRLCIRFLWSFTHKLINSDANFGSIAVNPP